MPPICIDVVEGRTDAELRVLADSAQEVMLDVFAAPERDLCHSSVIAILHASTTGEVSDVNTH